VKLAWQKVSKTQSNSAILVENYNFSSPTSAETADEETKFAYQLMFYIEDQGWLPIPTISKNEK